MTRTVVTLVPSLAKVEQILGPYSIASVKTWLKSQKLPSTANSRADINKRVHKLLEDGRVPIDDVIEALIGIEEAASKLVHIYTIDINPKSMKLVNKQLADTKVVFSSERTPAVGVIKTPKQIYAIDTSSELRVKWAESQTRVSFDKRTRAWSDISESRIIVLVVNKEQVSFSFAMTSH